jgi:hypothetical protein
MAQAEAGLAKWFPLGASAESSTWAQRLQQTASGFQLEMLKVNCADRGLT